MKRVNLWEIKSYSGVRGIYGVQVTPEVIYRIVNAYVSIKNPEKVIIGRDTRPSGIPLKYAAISSLTTAGCKVIDVDVSPTPAILYFTKELKQNGGIVISASHNPPEYNAIKIADKNGILIWDEELDEIIRKAEKGEINISKTPGTVEFREINNEYIDRIIKVIDVKGKVKEGLKVLIDPGGGAGSLTTPKMLSRIGCRVISINSIPGKFNRPIEPTEEALNETSKIVRLVNADVGFAHDCDADRLVCIDEKGKVIGEDYSMAIALRFILKNKKISKVVINIASSKVIQDIAEEYGAKIYWSKVGEANMIKKIIETDSDIGIEGSSGGLILKEYHLTRDGAIAALSIIGEISETGKTLSQIIEELPRYYMKKKNIPKDGINIEDKIESLNELGEINTMDGVKISSEDYWALIRPSKTEPKIRIIVEAKTEEKAIELMEKIIHKIS